MSIISLDPITFPLEHVGLCSQRSEADLTELTHDLAYQTIQQSPEWPELTNVEWDEKAEELAKVIQQAIDGWFDAPEVERLTAIMRLTDHLEDPRRAA